MTLYDSAVNEKMRTSPEFAAAENRVRGLERETNVLSPRVDELTIRVAELSKQLSFSDSDSLSGRRLAFSLDQARADLKGATISLANVRAQLAEAISERDALFDPKLK